MTGQQRLVAALTALLFVGLVSCGTSTEPADSGPSTLPAVEATLTGPLTDVRPMTQSGDSSRTLLGTVLVGQRRSQAPMPMVFDITERTQLFREYAGLGGSELSEIGFSELVAGSIARVGYSGPVRESYPAQGTADYVVLEDPGS